MEGRLSKVLFVAMAVAALFQGSSAQSGKQHIVGGTTVSGWTVPSDSKAYATWAAGQTFSVGDSLVFNFNTGAHDVTEVTKANYDSCTSTNPISQKKTGPATVTLNSTGTHYFICSIPGHCSGGQKLAVNVSSSSPAPQPAESPRRASPPTASAPSPSTTATPPSPGATPPPSGTTPSPSGSTTPSPSSGPASPGSGASSPTAGTPGSAAPSLAAAAGFSATLLSVALALLY